MDDSYYPGRCGAGAAIQPARRGWVGNRDYTDLAKSGLAMGNQPGNTIEHPTGGNNAYIASAYTDPYAPAIRIPYNPTIGDLYASARNSQSPADQHLDP